MSGVTVIVQKIPLVQTCCCGCSLHVGTLIITILELIGAISQFLTACISAAAVQIVKDEVDNFDEDAIAGLYALLVFLALYFLAIIIVASCAIHAARTGNRNLLLPWLYAAVVKIIISFIFSIVMIAKANDYADAVNHHQGDTSVSVSASNIVGQGVGNLLAILLEVYFFVVIYSYYIELGNPRVPQSGMVYPTVAGAPAGSTTVVLPPGATVAMGYQHQPGYAVGGGGAVPPPYPHQQEQQPPSYGKLTIN